jgi:hypothetical protein
LEELIKIVPLRKFLENNQSSRTGDQILFLPYSGIEPYSCQAVLLSYISQRNGELLSTDLSTASSDILGQVACDSKAQESMDEV